MKALHGLDDGWAHLRPIFGTGGDIANLADKIVYALSASSGSSLGTERVVGVNILGTEAFIGTSVTRPVIQVRSGVPVSALPPRLSRACNNPHVAGTGDVRVLD